MTELSRFHAELPMFKRESIMRLPPLKESYFWEVAEAKNSDDKTIFLSIVTKGLFGLKTEDSLSIGSAYAYMSYGEFDRAKFAKSIWRAIPELGREFFADSVKFFDIESSKYLSTETVEKIKVRIYDHDNEETVQRKMSELLDEAEGWFGDEAGDHFLNHIKFFKEDHATIFYFEAGKSIKGWGYNELVYPMVHPKNDEKMKKIYNKYTTEINDFLNKADAR